MLESVSHLSQYSTYILPPVVGAFIGYLTNKIAIKMLFRPLKPWKFLGIRFPMTPGVIPSKRKLLARNIGDMVGGHLLTSKEIGTALEKDRFQQQLAGLIKQRVGRVLGTELPSLPKLVPKKYRNHFSLALKTVSFQTKRYVGRVMASKGFEEKVSASIERGFEQIADRDVDSVISREERLELYLAIDRFIANLIYSDGMRQWLQDYLYGKISQIIKRRETLRDILPPSIVELLLQVVEEKTPDLLGKLVELLKEPEIQNKLIHGVKRGVDSFVKTLGPMGGMVQNFVNLETIEKVVKEYIHENEDNLTQWLEDKEVQKKLTDSLRNRIEHYLDTPVADYIKEDFNHDKLSRTIAEHILKLIRSETVILTISNLFKENIEIFIDGGNRRLENLLENVAGKHGVQRSQQWMVKEAIILLRSDEASRIIGQAIDQMYIKLMKKPVGKLSDYIPDDVRQGMYGSIQRMASGMLAAEVPGLVDSLDIRTIIAEKIDSLDLLRLERLLLSIMEEQFKYINLFGALLGFLIGSLNVLFLQFLH